ncbi:MAG: hypothetical protein HWE39_14685 [Oceanospirillaceae bacterium]|nr:hypothetical protein [Oceanospirillaceae bacterium]
MNVERSDKALLGAPAAPLVLYLPNPPRYPVDHPRTNTAALIDLNGNHWRKILTILAKIACSPASDWRRYRDQALLQRSEAISFADSLEPSAGRHLVAGKASWERLGCDIGEFTAIDDGRLHARGNILLTPYPDYRQFPNRTIERVREWLRDSGSPR